MRHNPYAPPIHQVEPDITWAQYYQLIRERPWSWAAFSISLVFLGMGELWVVEHLLFPLVVWEWEILHRFIPSLPL